jgi:hypothetical protein
MALSQRDIVITPNRGAATEPTIRFTGADASSSATITLRVINSSTVGTLSFEGSAGQLFAVTDSMVGTIFSVNDVSGIPSIEVLDTGAVKLAQYNGFVTVSTATSISGAKLTVQGGTYINGTLTATNFVGNIVGNVTGSASSAGDANYLISNDTRTISPSSHTAGKLRFGFTAFSNNSTSPYADYLHLRSYVDASGGNDNLVMFRKDVIGMRIWQQAWGSGTAYASYKDIAVLSISDNAPSNPGSADLWWQSSTGRMKVRYSGPSGNQWVDVVPVIDTSLFFSKAGGAISGPVSINGALDVTGNISATAEITAYYSDRRLKTDIVTIENALVKVKKLNGVTYRPNALAESYGLGTNSDVVGLFADEVEQVLPQAVKSAPFDIDENGVSKSGENYKTIQYEKVVPLLVEAIKEQQKIIEAQQAKIDKLIKHLGLED